MDDKCDYACYLKNTEAWWLIYCGRKRSDTQNEVFSFNSMDKNHDTHAFVYPVLYIKKNGDFLTINVPMRRQFFKYIAIG